MSAWDTNRTKPYTMAGIARLLCIRCAARPAHASWQICSDGGRYRPICKICDIELNALILEWVRHPRAAELIDAYTRKALKEAAP
jgi:hypothetical protein